MADPEPGVPPAARPPQVKVSSTTTTSSGGPEPSGVPRWLAEAPARPHPADPLVLLESKWAIKAAEYARREVTPRYGPDDTPTNYEKGMIQHVAACYRDGYLAACEEARSMLAEAAVVRPHLDLQTQIRELEIWLSEDASLRGRSDINVNVVIRKLTALREVAAAQASPRGQEPTKFAGELSGN